MSILVLTSDTLSSPAAAGQIEYASPIFAATPVGTQRGIVPTQQYYRLDSAYVGSNVATAQSMFGVGCTLSSSTVYEFEIFLLLIKTAGTTSHSVQVGFSGTATLNNIQWQYNGTLSGAPTKIDSTYTTAYATATTSLTLSPASTTAGLSFFGIIKGTVSVNAGGTFIPQYTLSAAPGGAYTTAIGSYIRINPLSASGAATNVGTWA
jgi:hypothetical protein